MIGTPACDVIIRQCTIGNIANAPLKSCFLDTITEFCGYNQLNTLTYAIIALVMAYLIYRLFEKKKIAIDSEFIQGIAFFVLFGSTMRVITDAVTTGTCPANAITTVHLYDYSIFTATPGIYIIVGGITLAALYITHVILNKKEYFKYIGGALFLVHALILLSYITCTKTWLSNLAYGAAATALALAGTAIAITILKRTTGYFKQLSLQALPSFPKLPAVEQFAVLAVFAHALDGAATYVIIDIFSNASGMVYFEQHVLPRFLASTPLGYLLFFCIKVAVAAAAAYFVLKDDSVSEDEKKYILLIIMIFGLAPGVRDLLRMIAGA
ncbi:hypothetical protein COT30_02175 [Candidatus Micrarchaeota archaeon CG08_land_8_20_14_0_20_49_17]|nr:MAG: hypothetical protein AUJ13_01335 [Candidatus Micrarchaeota archaeon CG1_02_49_24]PIU09879.1 MAG: hypothetical protein COT30_02175 [Candidatus Micrarchaeota archaeon CG08_land_8_20_14_0_20_49_17]PIU81474.1 MAG: hypothetical protein COS70_03895 [Candidatus Micrarchaeota archaeon CG06_land_8_20_14_3_00_50_6]HII53323.1 DUF63 family protein [Candidatus Micrarchaeota archaeon]